jgi:SAM-dependent methyltransferase
MTTEPVATTIGRDGSCRTLRAVGLPLEKRLPPVKSLIFRFAPLARRVLPRRFQRFLLLKVLRVNDRYGRMRSAGSRIFLEQDLLPWISAHYRHVLFVGTASYTYHYEHLFRREQYTTLDLQERNAPWGADDHIVGPIEKIDRYRPEGSFDCVILSGVFGFGVDTIEHMRKVVEALSSALRPGGLLVVGWNTNLHEDPEALDLYAPYFERNRQAPFTARRHFPPETHVFDFYVRSHLPRESGPSTERDLPEVASGSAGTKGPGQ